MPAPSYRSEANAADNTFGVSSLAVDVPAGTVDGDCMITFAVTASIAPAAAATFTPPAGWTLLRSETATQIGGAVNSRLAVYRRIAASEPANYTWNISTNAVIQLKCISVQDANLIAPTPITPSFNAGTGTSLAAASVTTTRPGTYLLGIFSSDQAGNAFTAPAGMTERSDDAVRAVADTVQAASGASATHTATASISGSWIVYLIPIEARSILSTMLENHQ